jgi:hypothetical protein
MSQRMEVEEALLGFGERFYVPLPGGEMGEGGGVLLEEAAVEGFSEAVKGLLPVVAKGVLSLGEVGKQLPVWL